MIKLIFALTVLVTTVMPTPSHAQLVRDLLRDPEKIGPIAPKPGIVAPTNLIEAPNRVPPEPLFFARQILEELKKGGVAIYLHHTEASASADEKKEPNWWLNCFTTRELTEKGIATAVSIGNAIKRARIPVSEVRTSEFCRALDTGSFIGIGRARSFAGLNTAEVQAAQGRSPAQIAAQIKSQLLSVPTSATSTIFVGHAIPIGASPSPVLAGLAEGDSALFKRTESGELQFIARLTPGQWEALALEDEAERLRVAAAIREAQTRPLAVAQPGGLPSKDAPSEAAVSLPKLSLALLDELRRGGLVLHMRHAVADRGQDANFDVVDDWQKHCILQRNLGTKGLAEAKKVGEALRALRIPIGEVITSEFCRAQDTAKEMGLAVDRALPEFNLQVSQKPVPDAAKKRIEWLGKPPPEGKNRLFVSHSHPKSNSTDQPIEKSQTAEVVVYRTRLDGPPVAIASIGVADWAPFLNRAPAQ